MLTAEEVGGASGEVGEVGADGGVLACGVRFGLWRRKRAGRQRSLRVGNFAGQLGQRRFPLMLFHA